MNLSHKYLVLLLLAFLPFTTSAREVGEVEVAEQVTLAGTTLQLNGAGIRNKFFFDIYVGALYLPKKTRDAAQAMGMSGPKRVLMHFLYKEVSQEKIVNGWNEGFEDNLSAQQFKAMADKLKAFNQLFVTVKRGDSIELDYLPDSGTRVSINGQIKGSVPGSEFYSALLSIWLGDEPADSGLKEGMLGGD